MYSIAILGGSFDPIHNGHLRTSINIQKQFHFDTFIFLPCKTPTLKLPTVANTTQRIEMLKLAVKSQPNFKLDLREIERNTPSYMVETLESFRKEYPNASITLVLGYDTFLALPQWHQWEKIITLAHLLVINRAGIDPIPDLTIKKFLEKHQNNNKLELLTNKAGSIFLFNAGEYEISSTTIRDALKKGINIKKILPSSVYRYIKAQKLYQ